MFNNLGKIILSIHSVVGIQENSHGSAYYRPKWINLMTVSRWIDKKKKKKIQKNMTLNIQVWCCKLLLCCTRTNLGTGLPWVFFCCVCVDVCAHPSSGGYSYAFYSWPVSTDRDHLQRDDCSSVDDAETCKSSRMRSAKEYCVGNNKPQ